MAERRQDVLAVGEILIDFVAPDAPDLDRAGHFIRAPGGAPANVAVAASRLGSRAGFVGAIGADAFGGHLRAVLEENGVDTEGLQTVQEQTTLAFVARNDGGIPDFLFYRGADAALSPEMLPIDLLGASTFVYVSSMALLSEPSRSATLRAVAQARTANALVAVDPNLRPGSWPSLPAARGAILGLLDRADIVKVNEQEACLLADTPDLSVALNRLSGSSHLLVVTRGIDGAAWRWRNTSGSVEAPRVEVVDTTGAGDAFMGALLADLCRRGYSGTRFWALRRDDIEGAVRFACAAGALTCTAPGVMPALPTLEDVRSLLEEKP